MNFFFRVDANRMIGAGHLKRCLSLAAHLRSYNAKISFICNRNTLVFYPELKNQYSVHLIENDSDEVGHWLDNNATLILDHYGLGLEWEQKNRKYVKQLVVIDDLLRVHDADVLIDQNFRLDSRILYAESKISDHKLIGTKFCILDPSFLEARKHLKPYLERPENIFVCFGGSDTSLWLQNYIAAWGAAVQGTVSKMNFPLWQSTIVAGAGCKDTNLKELAERAGINFHFQSDKIAKLMSGAQLAVGAGGSMHWERLCLGLPSIVVTIAENQRKISEDLNAAKYISLLNDNNNLQRKILELITDVEYRQELSKQGMRLIDAKGTKRIACVLVSKYLNLRDAKSEDCRNIYDWRNSELNRKYSLNPELINWQTHQEWFDKTLATENKKLLIASDEFKDIGVIRFDIQQNRSSEISIYLVPGYHNQGYGLSLLFAAENWLKKNTDIKLINAKILDSNLASVSIFKDAQYEFSKLENNYQIWSKSIGNEN